MYARGATPERPFTAGGSFAAGAFVPESPAAMPATCVPWYSAGSSGLRPGLPEPGPGKVRATITFGVVALRSPFGKPAGYEYPVALRKGFVQSTPVSTTPTFTPSPRIPVVLANSVAPMIDGLWFSVAV